MITDPRANAILDTEYVDGDRLSLHTAYSATGLNELTGGSYARGTIDFAPAASRTKTLQTAVNITGLPAAAVVSWLGIWNSAGTTLKAMYPVGGDYKSFQVALGTDTFLCEGHGFVNNDTVVFQGSVPTPLVVGTDYFVVGVTSADPDTFQVSATQGGAAINITAQHGANCVVSKHVVETFANPNGTFQLTTWSASL